MSDNPSAVSSRPRNRRVGHARRVTEQRLHAAEALAKGEEPARRDERHHLVHRAVQLERHHPAEPRHLAPCDLVTGMIGQPREVDAPSPADARERVARSPRRCPRDAASAAPASCSPRSVSQQSNGDGTAPVAFCRNLTGSKTAASRASTAPWIRSEWPARYFVTLWTTRSAPRLNGCWKNGVANVLSTTTSAPLRVGGGADVRDVVDQQPRVGRRLDPHQPRPARQRRLEGGVVRDVHLTDDAADRLVDLRQRIR